MALATLKVMNFIPREYKVNTDKICAFNALFVDISV